MKTEKRNIEINETEEKTNERKEYTTPKLTQYGGISELVQMNLGAGGDGALDPSSNLS